MVEIYNEQVRDLLSNDIAQKRYPFSNCHDCFFHYISCIHVIKSVKE